MQTLHFHTIPSKPAGSINPAELPLAEAVLTTSQVDLIDEHRRPTLYYRLSALYTPFAEEFWVLLFGETPPAQAACLCLTMPATDSFEDAYEQQRRSLAQLQRA